MVHLSRGPMSVRSFDLWLSDELASQPPEDYCVSLVASDRQSVTGTYSRIELLESHVDILSY